MCDSENVLRPSDLAVKPVNGGVLSGEYSFETQMGASSELTTFNGTQTFDFQGNPRDSDND